MDHIKWDLEIGGVKSSGEVTIEPGESGELGEPKKPRDPKWGELMEKLGAALMKLGEKWQEEKGQE